jgi:Kef-type K+ transport system membrane component KefB
MAGGDLLLQPAAILRAAGCHSFRRRCHSRPRLRLGQPPVLGEILAGILLGPTFFHGRITTTLFPPALIPPLTALADIGLVLFMFVVGYEVDLRLIRGRKQAELNLR